MLAAYRLAIKEGQTNEEATKSAVNASDHAHGVYHRGTLPLWAQGSNPMAKMGQIAYVYAKFGHNYLQMLYDLGARKKDIPGLVYAMSAPIVLGGAGAVPFGEELKAMLEQILKLLGIRMPLDKFVWDQTRQHLGAQGERTLRYGMLGALGMDVTGSLSIGVGVPKGVADLSGAVGGVVSDAIKVSHFLKTDQYSKAVERALPTGLGNPLRAYREATRGVTTDKGYRVWDENMQPYRPSGAATALRTAGVSAAEGARLREISAEAVALREKWQTRRDMIYEMSRAYFANPNRTGKELTKIVDMATKFNTDRVSMGVAVQISPIKMKSIVKQGKNMLKPTRQQRKLLTPIQDVEEEE
jgi:hypothetical protein